MQATLATHTLPVPSTLNRGGLRASIQPATDPLTDATVKSKFALNPKSIVLSDLYRTNPSATWRPNTRTFPRASMTHGRLSVYWRLPLIVNGVTPPVVGPKLSPAPPLKASGGGVTHTASATLSR